LVHTINRPSIGGLAPQPTVVKHDLPSIEVIPEPKAAKEKSP